MAGRRPKATVLKIIGGNPGNRPLNKLEPKPPIEKAWVCPTRLTGEARKEWNRMAKMLHETGLLTRADRNSLVLYCESHAIYMQSWKQLNAMNSFVEYIGKDEVPRASPHIAIIDKMAARMLRILIEFGMTPSARSKVQVAPLKGADDSEWGELDNG